MRTLDICMHVFVLVAALGIILYGLCWEEGLYLAIVGCMVGINMAERVIDDMHEKEFIDWRS